MLKPRIKRTLKSIALHFIRNILDYSDLDSVYLPLDKKQVRRTKNILLIPELANRRGGKAAYAEWAHVIGIFQTLMYLCLDKKENNRVLDIGCGTGLLAIASEPFLGDSGCYTGIDVQQPDIAFCQNHFPDSKFSFVHFNVMNRTYNPQATNGKQKWNIESESFDLVTALSVWTHLDEEDAYFYLKEIERVLKPGGKAIITFFLMDDLYKKSLPQRTNERGQYHTTPQNKWIFDKPAHDSDAWFYPAWAKVPEEAIGITNEGFNRLLSGTGLVQLNYYPGNWKEIPGIFFQDVVIFQKPH